jgi:hypothetical protein
MEAMIEREMEIERNTIECCVEPGCGTHYLSEMSECTTCGHFMCSKHVCDCPIPGWEEFEKELRAIDGKTA